jgi:hypothetical protein
MLPRGKRSIGGREGRGVAWRRFRKHNDPTTRAWTSIVVEVGDEVAVTFEIQLKGMLEVAEKALTRSFLVLEGPATLALDSVLGFRFYVAVQSLRHDRAARALEAEAGIKLRQRVALLASGRDRNRYRRAPLAVAPIKRDPDHHRGSAAAAPIWKDIDIANLAKQPPFDIPHRRYGHYADRYGSFDSECAPAASVRQHIAEVSRDLGGGRGKALLREKAREEIDGNIHRIRDHWLDPHRLHPASTTSGVSGAWQTASMRWPSGSSTKAP